DFVTAGNKKQKKGMFQAALGNLKIQTALRNRDRAERLRAAVAFLIDAEQGKADVSDAAIDRIAGEASRRHAEAERQREADTKARLARLEEARNKLFASFKKSRDAAGE